MLSSVRLPCLLVVIASFSGCITGAEKSSGKPPATPPSAAKRTNYWSNEQAGASSSIVINLTAQRAYFYKGDKAVGEANISSGRKGFETPVGSFAVIQKDKEHVSNLYGEFVDADGNVVKSNVDVSKDKPPEGATFSGAKMPYFLRFTGGFGLHAGRVPGHRASHGCVRLPREMAVHFYETASIGTPVVIEE
jgi:lipoprotein-anchoring transpeptidase ErfK/SrfK